MAERDEDEEVDDGGDSEGLGLRSRRSGPVSKAVAAAQGQLLGSVDNVSGLLPGDSDAPDDVAAGDDDLLSEARADLSARSCAAAGIVLASNACVHAVCAALFVGFAHTFVTTHSGWRGIECPHAERATA